MLRRENWNSQFVVLILKGRNEYPPGQILDSNGDSLPFELKDRLQAGGEYCDAGRMRVWM